MGWGGVGTPPPPSMALSIRFSWADYEHSPMIAALAKHAYSENS
jgi:hypothetical protein